MHSFRILALTPPATWSPTIAIAASRAGELGVLDLEHATEVAATRRAIADLAAHAADCGVKLDNEPTSFFEEIIAGLPEEVATVVLVASDPTSLPRQVEELHRLGRKVLLEVTDAEQVTAVESSGVDGVVSKGSESGGWVGEETSFILLQRLLSALSRPVFAQGGMGLRSAAAAVAAGAAGIVLDSQLLLTRESMLPDEVKDDIARMDGSETVRLGSELGASFRVYARPGLESVVELERRALKPREGGVLEDERAEWRREVRQRIGWSSDGAAVRPVGEDAALARELAERFHTVGGVLTGIRRSVERALVSASEAPPLAENGPLATSHGTRYPILQGPMTRVSDRAEFALAVADGGALPFMALALLRAPEVEKLLEETRRLLGERPWGVGILGFVPRQLREEQLEVIRRYRPRFALIAGGRSDQAHELERDGIATYLHAPSPGLLQLFLRDGGRRFIFEGQECGGHVGPRSSFVLWDSALAVLEKELPAGQEESCHVVFAGGIHDGLSASMVGAMAAPLAERGFKIGVLLGTSYLFTREAVDTGAILRGFQQHAVGCRRTVLVDSGPGHAVRIVESPYAEEFRRRKRQLLQEGASAEETRRELETMNLGRLRIASKGVRRHPDFGKEPRAPKYLEVGDEDQHRDGMYMIGQLAALRDRTCTIDELHAAVIADGCRALESLRDEPRPVAAGSRGARLSQVAIVGMSAILPRARTLEEYWENILGKVDAVTEIPKERWDWERYFDPDPNAKDKIYSKWGGFIGPEPFDPVEFGMPPNSVRSIDPMQLLALKVAREALRDAGYLDREFDRSRTSVILGASGGTGDMGAGYLLRSSLPLVLGDRAPEVIAGAQGLLPEWTEDSFAGLLLNVAAGRIANRFDLGGLNCVVDAACASSLAAVHLAVKELETGNTDMALVGGVDTTQNPFGYLCFSKTRALSPTGRSRTFDEEADGIAISEGLVMLVLKRLADAERDGDRVYAVIQAVAGSSDGRSKGMTAPRPEGQMLALRRAYDQAGISPSTVGLFEAHGTGTAVGDRSEAEAVSRILEESGTAPATAAIGSVKSMIGHTKATAGVAGLAKVALALHHRILPPTIGVTRPNGQARFGEGPLYVNTESRPWLSSDDGPRRAGVNSFGFGGTNFHAILEEYGGAFLPREAPARRWPSELLLWQAASPTELADSIRAVAGALDDGASPELRDLAYSVWRQSFARRAPTGEADSTLAIVAVSLDDLRSKLERATELVGAGTNANDPRGIFFSAAPSESGKVAFVFPGQGSQYPNMARDLVLHFEEVQREIERFDRALAARFPGRLSRLIFPPPAFDTEEEKRQQQALTRTDVAQPALGAVDMAAAALLDSLGVRPELVAGHSYGEYVALCAAAVYGTEMLAVLSEARGRSIIEAAKADLGIMAAVNAGREAVEGAIEGLDEVWIANLNAPEQTIISGTKAGVKRAAAVLEEQDLGVRSVPVACAFHSPLVAPARERLAALLTTVDYSPPSIDVYSNTTAAPYPKEPQAIASQLADHLVKPVRFAEEIEAMHDAGARVFVEVGPRNVLTGLIGRILSSRPHVAIAVDSPGRHGLTQLQHALAQLATHGVAVSLDRLFDGRRPRKLNLSALVEETREPVPSATTWLVDGGSARPYREQAAVRSAEVTVPEVDETGGEISKTEHETDAVAIPVLAAGGSSLDSVPVAGESGEGAVPGSDAATARAVIEFQRLMGRFLETEGRVMRAYLEGQGAAAVKEAEALAQTRPAASVSSTPTSSPRVEPSPDRPIGEPTMPVEAPAGAAEEIAAPAAASESASDSGMDLEELTARVLEIVGDRTGYPVEMLDLDVDIEADLGIDSIKRVEILGSVQKACLPADFELPGEAMEQLTASKTLRGIVEWLEAAVAAGPGGAVEEAVHRREEDHPVIEETGTGQETALERGDLVADDLDSTTGVEAALGETPDTIPRSMLTPKPAPPEVDSTLPDIGNRVVLITDDDGGAAVELAERLRREGERALLIQHRESAEEVVEEDAATADLTDPRVVNRLVDEVRRRHGAVGGILHLLPLADEADSEAMDVGDWRRSASLSVKSLCYLARAAAEDLLGAGNGDEGFCLAATPMAGAFGGEGSPPGPFNAVHAGVAGLVKTLALELPGVRCRVAAVGSPTPADLLATRLVDELKTAAGPVEVVYLDDRRMSLEPRLAPLPEDRPPSLELDSQSVVLLTGGACGITAEVACALAESYRPTLVLAGRSPLPPAEEPSETRHLTTPRELKAALIERRRAEGRQVAVTEVEADYARLLKDRAIRANLERMRSVGARVEYHQVDVRDQQAMTRLVTRIDVEHGRLDGVIHGAGVIEDKLIRDKQPESFDRVFDTKVDGALILSRLLRPESLRFLAFFASASGPFGNRGQGDYAAANEVLNKLAIQLDRRWPGRVVSINWGPWQTTGMAAGELQAEFARRGIALIAADEGCRLFERELRCGRKGEAEVICAGGAWSAESPVAEDRVGRPLPLVQRARISDGGDQLVEAIYPLDPSRDLYLQDHRLDAKPVMPVAIAMELMAEVAQRGWPHLQVSGLRELRVLRGLVVDNGPKEVRVRARADGEERGEEHELDVGVELYDSRDRDLPCYRATVELASRLPEPPSDGGGLIEELHPFPMPVAEAYRRWLFHGPLLQGIKELRGIAEHSIEATLEASLPSKCLAGRADGSWLIDPVVFDSGLQLFLLWARAHLDKTPLPSRFRRYRRFGSADGGKIDCHVDILDSSRDPVYHIDVRFVGENGRLLGLLEDMEGACSRSLNRLGSEVTGGPSGRAGGG